MSSYSAAHASSQNHPHSTQAYLSKKKKTSKKCHCGSGPVLYTFLGEKAGLAVILSASEAWGHSPKESLLLPSQH